MIAVWIFVPPMSTPAVSVTPKGYPQFLGVTVAANA
jgi:hypothetical protein